MRSFRARVERGRIIVHEPIDLPDGVILLVPIEVPSEARDDGGVPARAVDAPRVLNVEPLPSDQRSSS